MGGMQAKEKCIVSSESVAMERLKNKVKILQEEIHEIMCIRDAENQAYERELMVFALKEVEWKKEKKKLKDEVKKLKKKMEGIEENININNEGNIEEKKVFDNNNEKKFEYQKEIGLLKMMEINYREVQNSRDEAVEKWKQLYFAIKIELDDLIQRTYQGGMLWKAEEEETMVEKLQKEVKSKEETIKNLKEQITAIKKQEYKHERELDILRQSLRIMCFNRRQQEAIRVTKHTRTLRYFRVDSTLQR